MFDRIQTTSTNTLPRVKNIQDLSQSKTEVKINVMGKD